MNSEFPAKVWELVCAETEQESRLGMEMLACFASPELANEMLSYVTVTDGLFSLAGIEIKNKKAEVAFLRLFLEMLAEYPDDAAAKRFIETVTTLKFASAKDLEMLARGFKVFSKAERVYLDKDLLGSFALMANAWPKLSECFLSSHMSSKSVRPPWKAEGKPWDQLRRLDFDADAGMVVLPKNLTFLLENAGLDVTLHDCPEDSKVLRSFRRLSLLRLVGGRQRSLPLWKRGFAKVDRIDARESSISDIPDEVAWALPATKLSLEGLTLTRIPSALLARPDIIVSTFNLRWTKGMKFQPALIGHIERLIACKLDWTEIPAWVFELKELREVDFSFNPIATLPPGLFQLPCLEKITVTDAAIAAIPLPENADRLSPLRSLDLARNRISQVPESLDAFRELESLNLSGNALSSLPASIGNLASLTTLCLNRNALADLPAEISRCTKLRELRLSNNRLRSLPFSIATLVNLTVFSQGQQDDQEFWNEGHPPEKGDV
ncbi:MAG: leucine-rich repeat domain-containing protein [Rectinemataceae bacterium]